MGAQQEAEKPAAAEAKPAPAPFPSVTEQEKKDYRNGYFRRTCSNVKRKTFAQKLGSYTSLIIGVSIFVPIIIAATLYTYMFVLYTDEQQTYANVAFVQQNVADRLWNLYMSVFDLGAARLDPNSTFMHLMRTHKNDAKDFLRVVKVDEAFKLATGTFIAIWFAGLPLFLCALYAAWTLFKKLLPQGARPVYVLDFATLKPDQALRVSYPMFEGKSRSIDSFTEESIQFQNKILTRSCISDTTTFPPGVHYEPPRITMEYARDEANYVFKRVVGDCLKMCNLKAKDIDILIVNCSLFCPTPSLSAMIINMFGMREDVKNYNLGGMGCSAGLISIDLARDLLQVYKNSNCLVVSTENITQNWYHGNEKSCLMSNTLFRMGGAAILLTNKPGVKSRAKYELVTTTRVMRGADQESYDCVFQLQDPQMKTGVRLSPNLIRCATKAVTKNLTKMLMKNVFLLPLGEIYNFAINTIKMKLFKSKDDKPYIPNFGKIFDHFCIHAGGRKVLDDLGRDLQLGDKIKPSRAALFCFGNTSSATTWYELEYVENSGKLKKGDKVLQMAFGSGFKCNSVVWKALQTLDY